MKIPNYFNKIGTDMSNSSGNKPLTLTSLGDGGTIYIQANGFPVVDGLQYRLNSSSPWQVYNCGYTFALDTGEYIQFQNTNEELSTSTLNYVTIQLRGTNWEASGNVQSLLNYSQSCKKDCFYRLFASQNNLFSAPILVATTLAEECFRDMFNSCKNLIIAPELPAMNMVRYCYWGMFYNCSSLTTAPKLPATILEYGCYDGMFRNCTNLTTAPELPATKLATDCYRGMFNGCSSLTSAPELPATTLANNCYYDMFYGCTSLTTASKLPATALSNYCYYDMFYGCTSLTTAPELPATTLANYCYYNMFYRCTGLTSAPELPATTLAFMCYTSMFYGCTKLNYIKVGFTEWDSTATSNWVNGVSSTGTFDAPRELSLIWGTSNIPEGWNLPNHQNMIVVEDQKIFSVYTKEINYVIDYLLQPETLQPTFTIIEGSLPNGLTLSSDGKITGTSTEEFDGNVVIQISCEGCESVTMTLSLFLFYAIETENNLTSNTSNEKYEVSQSTDYSSNYVAWKAMDGSDSTYSRTVFDFNNVGWWQIKFNEGPVILKYITGNFQGYSASNTLYLDVSNDGETFENVTSFTGGSDLIIKTELNTPYQYYRIRNANNGYYTQIYEIKFLYN